MAREWVGQRLDSLLHYKFPHHSRSYYQKIIKEGKVFVNNKNVRRSYNCQFNDDIMIKVPPNKNWINPENIPLDVIFENEDLVAVNKAAWQIVHPTGQTQGGTVLNALHARHKKNGGDDKDLPKVLHRLDQETSGVLVFAKGKNAGYYGQLFEQRKTKKNYLALLEGELTQDLDCRELIGNNKAHLVHLAQWVVPDGKPAITKIFPMVSMKGLTFCRIQIETGRLHQIRVHSAYHGFPVFGDSLYNPQDKDTIRWLEGREPQIKHGRPKRQLLHAYQLEFSLLNGEKITLKAPLPSDFLEWGGKKLVEFWNNYDKS